MTNMPDDVAGYSSTQVALHWTVVVLVAFQFVAHDAIAEWWRETSGDGPRPAEPEALASMHAVVGVSIFALALARIYLRMTRGAPPPPPDEPWLLKVAAEAVHVSIYVLLLALPATGALAWFFGLALAADTHEFLTNILLAAIALHVSGALFQHFVRRTEVLMRMFLPDRR